MGTTSISKDSQHNQKIHRTPAPGCLHGSLYTGLQDPLSIIPINDLVSLQEHAEILSLVTAAP